MSARRTAGGGSGGSRKETNMARKKSKFSKMQIECAIDAINAGTESAITVDGLVDAARRKVGKRQAESRNATRTINGRIVRRTEKAVLFGQISTSGESIIDGEQWWPLSQATPLERAMGPLDSLRVPEWLYAKKLEEVVS